MDQTNRAIVFLASLFLTVDYYRSKLYHLDYLQAFLDVIHLNIVDCFSILLQTRFLVHVEDVLRNFIEEYVYFDTVLANCFNWM